MPTNPSSVSSGSTSGSKIPVFLSQETPPTTDASTEQAPQPVGFNTQQLHTPTTQQLQTPISTQQLQPQPVQQLQAPIITQQLQSHATQQFQTPIITQQLHVQATHQYHVQTGQQLPPSVDATTQQLQLQAVQQLPQASTQQLQVPHSFQNAPGSLMCPGTVQEPPQAISNPAFQGIQVQLFLFFRTQCFL